MHVTRLASFPPQSAFSNILLYCSVTKSCLTLCNPMDCNTLGFPILHYLSEFIQTHVHWVSDVIQPSHLFCPLVFLPLNFPSIRVFSNELALRIRWPNYWRFSISSSNEYSGLMSFRIDWFDLLAARGIPKSLVQYHNSKASILRCSALLIVQLSHLYKTTGKIIVLTIQTFVGKLISQLFKTLSRSVTSKVYLLSKPRNFWGL